MFIIFSPLYTDVLQWDEYFKTNIPGYLKLGCFEFENWIIIKNDVREYIKDSVFDEKFNLVTTGYDNKIISFFSNKEEKFIIKPIKNWLTNKEIIKIT